MAQVILFGTDASVSMPSGMGAHFNAFSFAVSQAIARAVGFGDSWVSKRGTAKDASGTISGHTTKGTTGDQLGTTNMSRTGSNLTLTFYTGCTITGSAIFSGIGAGVDFNSAQSSSYSYEFDGTVTETWATT